ncbi:MAG: c-type cytochrome [Rhodospirillales bacterium]|nr:c-type cytochrome [Rhodospirillales bacterium]
MDWRRFAGMVLLAVPLMAGRAHAQDAATIVAHGSGGTPACATCHGAQGQGNAGAGFPRLAGDPAEYLRAQLEAFAAGTRQNPIMMPIAKTLNAAQMEAIAQYFAGLTPPPMVQVPATGLGADLALYGRAADRLPACEKCHGPGGVGVAPSFPALAGQPAAYIEAQIEAWQKKQRPPGPLGLMPAIAARLSPTDTKAVSTYFASLAAPEKQP